MFYRLAACSLLLVACSWATAESALIAVASNMSHTVQEIAGAFKLETNSDVSLSFGSSGNLTHQIINGSPHEVFLSADASHVVRLIDNDKAASAAKAYAIGRLCLFIPRRSNFNQAADFHAISHRLAFDRFKRLAIANPATAPYGKAALSSLQSLGIWNLDLTKLVIAENVSQATQFGLTRSVDLAFIPYSHFLLPKVRQGGHCKPVPEHLHSPIVQTMVMTKSAGEVAKSFFNFMSSLSARDILAGHGYHLPDNS